jgi:hypothetical protein
VIFGLYIGAVDVFYLVLHAKLPNRIGGIFWKVFRRSCGPPTKLVGSTVRSAGLLVGWTHLSEMVMNLVSRDPSVPMSHKPRAMCRRSDSRGS